MRLNQVKMDWSEIQRRIVKFRRRREAFFVTTRRIKRMQRICLAGVRPVTEPVAWISQIQRSGGSLLSQLFDGHPQIHAHPHEIKVGHPKKHHWPPIELSAPPRRWFKLMFEESVLRFIDEGYQKQRGVRTALPFVFLPRLQREIFLQNVPEAAASVRQVFDAYMTSFFGAWLNNQNYAGSKRWITGFTPRLFDDPQNVEQFFSTYPDGLVISIIRHPKNWFPSALRHSPKLKKDKYGEVRSAMDQWNASTQAAVRNKARFGERVCILRFEDLIAHTRPVMCHLAERLDLAFDEILLVPTFNRFPIEANTSFESRPGGILTDTLTRHKTLPGEWSDIIAEKSGRIYEEALNHAVTWP